MFFKTVRYFLLPCVLCSLSATPALSAETEVSPGVGTLTAAIAAASAGDTLVLGPGDYIGNVLIDKSLTLRGTNSEAVIMLSGGTFVVEGTGAEVVIQGLDIAMDLDVNAAADVKILENTFYTNANIDPRDYKTTDGDGGLWIIGNHLNDGSAIFNIYSHDAYVAGNTLDKGYIYANVPVWIVGNFVNGSSNVPVISVNISGTGSTRIIGNRVLVNHTSGAGTSVHRTVYGIYANAASALIAGNIVEITRTFNYPSYQPNGYEYTHGVYNANGTAKIYNNIVDGHSSTHATRGYGIRTTVPGDVSGNVVIDMASGGVAIGGSGAHDNLCFNNSDNTCGSDAITEDPNFANTSTYALTADSPAIDAGPTSPFLSDLDRTRNDIGAYGGPWSIGQYDAQRDPLYLAPFVFPLFDANSSFVDGKLQVRALGVARLR